MVPFQGVLLVGLCGFLLAGEAAAQHVVSSASLTVPAVSGDKPGRAIPLFEGSVLIVGRINGANVVHVDSSLQSLSSSSVGGFDGEFDATPDGPWVAIWDVANSGGSRGASGVYAVFIQGGGDCRTLKVAVQR